MKIKQVVKGLKSAAKSFSLAENEFDSVGEYQVGDRDFACPVCAGKTLRKDPFHLEQFNPLAQKRKLFAPNSWTLACTNCGHIAFFAKEPKCV